MSVFDEVLAKAHNSVETTGGDDIAIEALCEIGKVLEHMAGSAQVISNPLVTVDPEPNPVAETEEASRPVTDHSGRAGNCRSVDNDSYCTEESGHEGWHAASDGHYFIHCWPAEEAS